MGLVLDCDEREGRPGQFVWLVQYTDGFREDFDHEDMFRSGISFADGRMTSGDGALRSESDHRRDLQRLVGKYAIEKEMRWIRLAQEELMQLDSKRVYYKTAQGKVRHGIYDAIAGTVGGKAKPNPRGIYATLKEATANKHMPKGETDVDEDEVRTGGGGVKSDEESDDEGGPDIDNSFYWTAEDDTWTDVMLHFGIEDDERQKLYFKWLKEEWKMGNKPEFRSDPGATHFFNPIKNKRERRRVPITRLSRSSRLTQRFQSQRGLFGSVSAGKKQVVTLRSRKTRLQTRCMKLYSMEKLFVKSGWITKTCSIIATMPEYRRKSPKAKAGKCIKFT